MLSLNINDYFKEIGKYPSGRPRLAVDYDKLLATPFNYFLIITERGVRVKTYGAKDLIYKKWNGKTPSGLWLRTLADDASSELLTFFSDTTEDIKEEEFIFRKDIAFSKNKKPLLMLTSVAKPSRVRGSRLLLDYVVWDEFNMGVSGKNYKSLVENWSDILLSTSNVDTARRQKAFLLGNNKSFNHPVLVNLGITSITHEVTPIYEEGIPLMLIIFPIISEAEKKDIEEENKDNPQYLLMKRLGTAAHAYLNQSQFDELNGVYTPSSFDDLLYWPKLSFRTNAGVIRCYAFKKKVSDELGRVFVFISDDLLKSKYHIRLEDHSMLSKKADMKNGDDIITTLNKDVMMELIATDKILFADVSTKNFFFMTFK